ncbi:hypothetical protein DFR70_11166 [Nocardia tenerifensis]|uniref:Uncharacterized protein n=1 Tax=Nocardia tenerifensis TaxID=228006 RepID=A0A318JUS3_9NOCA|nr:hypothetical protein [Nocardia tenerifensis]PXX59684.1 hypothetical protein DFR70_11166 [Nocardia tenerifensis]
MGLFSFSAVPSRIVLIQSGISTILKAQKDSDADERGDSNQRDSSGHRRQLLDGA